MKNKKLALALTTAWVIAAAILALTKSFGLFLAIGLYTSWVIVQEAPPSRWS